MSHMCLLSFFFQRYCAPRDLHSFPTRRSSDLVEIAVRVEGARDHRQHDVAGRALGQGAGPAADGLAERLALPRSEEHTSELQSLTNLVCRLLLEKKKKKR